MKFRDLLKKFSLSRISFRKKPQESTTPLLQPLEVLDRATNDDVFERPKRPVLSARQKLELRIQWDAEKPNAPIYEEIADITSEKYAQKLAMQGKIDPRNDAANASDAFEINVRRRKALRKTIGLNPDRKE